MGISNVKTGNKQMAINMATNIVVFALGLCVTFFLTPYIVKKLGTAAYGFIGLSNNILGYTSLLTVALNSMAGRFITVAVHKGEISKANAYITSVFFTNLIIGTIIFIAACVVCWFLPDLIRIPENLVGDVQALFVLMAVSSSFGLLLGSFGVSCFITNRLDLSNIRSMISQVIRVVLLLLMFGFLTPHLWYFGLTGAIMTGYFLATNIYLFRTLTPELHLQPCTFHWRHVWEIASSGAWNILNKLSNILSRGFDLLLANLFISARAMGQLSLVLAVPMIILSFFGSIAGNFAPSLTKMYAEGDMEGMKRELFKSMRLLGFFAWLPVSVAMVYMDYFYQWWLPTEDSRLLYYLTIPVVIGQVVALPVEPLWNIFTITNKVRRSSLNLIYNSVLTFIVVLGAMFIVKDDLTRLFVLASTRTVFGIFRCMTFLPFYGSKCLDLPRFTFMPPILRNILNVSLICGLSLVFKHFCLGTLSGLGAFVIGGSFTAMTGFTIAWFTLLKPSDRSQLKAMIQSKLLRTSKIAK